MRRLRRRNKFAGEEVGSGDGVPHHEAGDDHDDRAPDERPVFGFLFVGFVNTRYQKI